jgi:hypothetical protein
VGVVRLSTLRFTTDAEGSIGHAPFLARGLKLNDQYVKSAQGVIPTSWAYPIEPFERTTCVLILCRTFVTRCAKLARRKSPKHKSNANVSVPRPGAICQPMIDGALVGGTSIVVLGLYTVYAMLSGPSAINASCSATSSLCSRSSIGHTSWPRIDSCIRLPKFATATNSPPTRSLRFSSRSGCSLSLVPTRWPAVSCVYEAT